MPRSWKVIGALGSGQFAPLLAEQSWTGGSRLVVLRRPAPPEAAAVSASGSPQVFGEEDRVNLRGRELGVVRFAAGEDVDTLLEGWPDGLPPLALLQVLAGALRALKDAGAPHGDLNGSSIRVGPSGRVALVAFMGRGAADGPRLRELAEDWGGLPEAALRAIEAGDADALEGVSVEGIGLQEVARKAGASPLHPHPWSGEVLSEQAPMASAHPKVRTATFAALTLILGLAAGWFLAPT